MARDWKHGKCPACRPDGGAILRRELDDETYDELNALAKPFGCPTAQRGDIVVAREGFIRGDRAYNRRIAQVVAVYRTGTVFGRILYKTRKPGKLTRLWTKADVEIYRKQQARRYGGFRDDEEA